MAPIKRKNIMEMMDEERFSLFFELIQERQRMEERYYRSGDQRLLAEIEEIRGRIREVKRGMGITF